MTSVYARCMTCGAAMVQPVLDLITFVEQAKIKAESQGKDQGKDIVLQCDQCTQNGQMRINLVSTSTRR